MTLCTTKAGVTKGNGVSSVDVPSVVHTGAVRTSLNSSLTASGPLSRASADVSDANLLTGVITATAVHAVSKTSHDGTGFKLQGSGVMRHSNSILATGTHIQVSVAEASAH